MSTGRPSMGKRPEVSFTARRVASRLVAWVSAAAFLVGTGMAACAPSEPQTGSQTNWLRTCDASAECGLLSCICGACTQPCDDDLGCSTLEGASCVAADEDGAVAVCGGVQYPSAGLCLPRCDEESCGEGAACVAGVCTPLADPSVVVTIDQGTRYQTLVGFGASLAYTEDEIVAHPRKVALFNAMFTRSGVDVVRMRNRFEIDNAGDLAATSEILDAATERMGRRPTTFITEGSPPSFLKQNDSRVCAGNLDTCTLIRLDSGEFDYAGFAEHWRASLEAHAAAGIPLDYLSIQNNPNWVPPESDPADACRFLPTEGTTPVLIGDVETEVEYPGFVTALDAVRAAIADLAEPPRLTVPEVTGLGALAEYAAPLDPADVDALAHHLYGMDPTALDEASFEAAGALASDLERPLFQTEMRAGGMDTAIFMQAALTISGASLYLQNDFAASQTREGGDDQALISLEAETFVLEDPFHAMRHFAYFTDPGWVRVDAVVDGEGVLVSAWMSPEEDALSVVLVNAGAVRQDASLEFVDELGFVSAEVTRTTFDGLERSAVLGALPDERSLELPAHSIVTVAFR